MLTSMADQDTRRVPQEKKLDEERARELRRQITEGMALEGLTQNPAWQVLRSMLVRRRENALKKLTLCTAGELLALQTTVNEIDNLLNAVDIAVRDGREALEVLAKLENE